jgi:YD repeat-containing protein
LIGEQASGTITYSNNEENPLSAIDDSGSLSTFSYDVNGLLLSTPPPSGSSTTFTWDGSD